MRTFTALSAVGTADAGTERQRAARLLAERFVVEVTLLVGETDAVA